MNIIRIPNHPVNSICYLIQYENNCIVIDPGTLKSQKLIEFIEHNELKPDYVIITHEHFDHIAGLNSFRDVFSAPVIACKICSKKITDPKKNLSIFYDHVGFYCSEADITFRKEMSLQWKDRSIRFTYTPGHSQGSICVGVDNILFTGDTIMPNNKIVVKLPGGDISLLQISVRKMFNMTDSNTLIYPGHGLPFSFVNIEMSDLL